MKKSFTSFIYASLFSVGLVAQDSEPVFNWVEQEISPNNRMRGMTTSSNTDAILAGYGRTFVKTTDGGETWNDVGIAESEYNFIDFSMKEQVGYLVSSRSKAIDYPTGSEGDIYASSAILKTTDGGTTWENLSLEFLGEGDDPFLNPNAAGCSQIDIQSVECVNDTVALMGVRWTNVFSESSTLRSTAAFITENGGESWKAITPSLETNTVYSILSNGNDFFIGGKTLLYKGIVGSSALVDLYPNLDPEGSMSAFIFDLDFYNDTELIITTLTNVYKSLDGGTTIEAIQGASGGNDFYKHNENVMITLGTTSKTIATVDGGVNWFDARASSTIYDFGGVYNDSIVALASDVIYKLAVSDLEAGNYSNWVTQTIHDGGNLQKMKVLDENTALLVCNGE